MHKNESCKEKLMIIIIHKLLYKMIFECYVFMRQHGTVIHLAISTVQDTSKRLKLYFNWIINR